MKFTLCITCWSQDVHMLNETLFAFKRQTVQPDEIIVVGNNLNKINVEDTNIVTFAEPKRKSPSFNRNKGAELATGDVIIYHDVDDIPHVQKVEIVKRAFLEQDVDAFVHSYTENGMYLYRYADFQLEKITKIKEGKYLDADTSKDNQLHHGHLSIKRELVNSYKYNEDIFFGEDSEFISRVFSHGHNVYFGNYKLINYRPSYKTNRSWYQCQDSI